MPRLVILNAGPDTAGVGIGLKRAFDKHASDWETRSVCRDTTYLEYPTDIVWPYGDLRMRRDIAQLVRDADVVHCMDSEAALFPFRSQLRGKRIIVHHLGTHFRRNPERASHRSRQFGALEVTDSVDLIRPHVRYLPVPIDIEEMEHARQAGKELAQVRGVAPQGNGQAPSSQDREFDASPAQAVGVSSAGRVPRHGMPPVDLSGRRSTIRIAHAPTNRAVKSTALITDAVLRLSALYPIDFDLIEGVSNAECVRRMARADLFVDQLTLGFGMAACEAWAMSIPVVSGLYDPRARARVMDMWGGRLPWANATTGTLEAVIEHLITDAEWRDQLARRGREHVDRWHSQSSVVQQTLAVYEGSAEAVA